MATLNLRLAALEQRSAATRYPDGLEWHDATMAALDTVGGGSALIERLDSGTATEADRAAMAALPGGEKRIRDVLTSLAKFYP